MELADFISMSGDEVKIPATRLSEYETNMNAEEYFGQKVTCIPCLYGTGNVIAGWQITSKSTAEVIGYMPLVTGDFQDYPGDFEYGITVVAPLSKRWTHIFNFKLRFIEDKIEINKEK